VEGGVLGINSTAIPGIFCCALRASSVACNAPGITVSAKKEVYCGAAFDNNQSAVRIFRSQHAVAQLRQHFRCCRSYIIVILDKQNSL
jgi:hypothetical protein